MRIDKLNLQNAIEIRRIKIGNCFVFSSNPQSIYIRTAYDFPDEIDENDNILCVCLTGENSGEVHELEPEKTVLLINVKLVEVR